MARYKTIDTSPRFIAVDLERQLLPGTFEHALNYLVDHQLDLSRFDTRYKNDFTGASAYPPAMLLKVVLFAYSRGIVRSRDIERACREQVTFIALSGDTAPHFTTFAGFVSTLGAEIEPLFKEVLLICDRQGLIGREMFAIDGVKLPSNASKAKSGTRADFLRQAEKMEAAAKAMLARHRENDALPIRTGSGREGSPTDRAPDAGSRPNAPVAQRQPRRAPGRQGQSHQEQPHRPRLGQDGHQQRRHPGLHRRRRR
jgi:transposase